MSTNRTGNISTSSSLSHTLDTTERKTESLFNSLGRTPTLLNSLSGIRQSTPNTREKSPSKLNQKVEKASLNIRSHARLQKFLAEDKSLRQSRSRSRTPEDKKSKANRSHGALSTSPIERKSPFAWKPDEEDDEDVKEILDQIALLEQSTSTIMEKELQEAKEKRREAAAKKMEAERCLYEQGNFVQVRWLTANRSGNQNFARTKGILGEEEK